MKSNSPSERYRSLLSTGALTPDPGQEQAVALLQQLHLSLTAPPPRHRKRWFGILREGSTRQDGMQGLYLWGGVGRGKSFLMDLFYHSVPGKRKRRVHFHDFMLDIHAMLRTLRNRSDPLKTVAAGVAEKIDLLCFDEFFVDDVADAMILGELLRELLNRSIRLVATSNIAPGDLYPHGLQRQRFLPAIRLIEQRLIVHRIGDGKDFRYRSLQGRQRYFQPLDDSARRRLEVVFQALAPDTRESTDLMIGGRKFRVEGIGADVVWFAFADLCAKPSAASDYLFLASHFHTVLLSGVPVMNGQEEPLQRFITLVDVLYDQRVNLIISAAAPPHGLYEGGRLATKFQRTISRLVEMQSEAYLAGQSHGE